MSCLAEERFVELLDQGGLDAVKPEEQAHLESCEACRDAWATVAAAGEVLADARPRHAGRTWWIPLAAAAAMLLTIIAVIAVRKTPSPVTTPLKDPLAQFLEGTEGEAKVAREALLKAGRKSLPGLAAARPRFKGSPRLPAIQKLMWDIKAAAAQQDPEQAAIVRKLDTLKVDLSFENTPVDDIIAFIRDFSTLNMVLDPSLQGGAVDTLAMKDTKLRDVLEVLCAVKGLDFDLKYGVVFISTPMRIWSTDPALGLPATNHWKNQPLNPADGKIADKFSSLRITLDMQSAPMSAIMDYLGQVSGQRLYVPDELFETLVSLKASDLGLPHVLELLTLPRGWDVRLESGTFIVFEKQK